ncbi:MAG: S41 family peptidase [Pseudomonadota bacterium]|nr:S41 family peptidase [Pseudomonadota bacterium]
MAFLKQIRLAIASIALTTGAAAAGAPTATEADVAAMRDYVEKNLAYTPATRAEAVRRLERLPGLIGDPARFELEAAAIAALADNGHSMLVQGHGPPRYPRSPVRLGLFADGLFVIAAPSGQQELVGREVLEINGRPWRAVRDAYARYQGGEQAFRDQFVTLFMETPALLAAAGLGEDRDQVALTVRNASGGSSVVSVTAEPPAPHAAHTMMGGPVALEAAHLVAPEALPLYLRTPRENWRLEWLPEADAAYIQLNAVHGEGVRAFLEETLTQLRARRPRNIILDLRFNMGGDLNLARDFVQALPGLAGGGLYAITSGRTFSAAISSLGYLKQAAGDRLTIVGEPIGDRLEFWAEGRMVHLPGLGAMLLYATERHNYMTGCPEADCHASIRDHPIRVATLQPDVPAPLSFADYRAGRDPAMEAIARLIRRGRD